MDWALVYFTSPDGEIPVRTYLSGSNLTDSEKVRLGESIAFLAEHGIEANGKLPDRFRRLTGARFRDLCEIRLRSTHNPRVFYSFAGERQIVLLDGVNKGGQSVRSMNRHYNRALRYLREWSREGAH